MYVCCTYIIKKSRAAFNQDFFYSVCFQIRKEILTLHNPILKLPKDLTQYNNRNVNS